MSYEVLEIPASEITVEGRYREDFGDIDQLVADIKKRGLLQPITVNQDFKLLAGGRRLQACVQAGLEEIPVIVRESKGEIDELEIELVENLHRKDLTWWEDASLTAKIYELTRNKESELGKRRKKRKKDQGSMRTAGEVCGKSLSQVSRDLKLASSVRVMPELKKCKTKKEALSVIDRALHSHEVTENVKKASAKSEEVLGSDYAKEEPQGEVQEEVETPEERAAKLFKRADANFRVGDAITGMQELAKVFEEQGYSPFGLIEIDPPYGVDLNKAKGGAEGRKEDYMKDYNEIPKEEYPQFLKRVCEAAYGCCNDAGFVILWFGWEWFHEAKSALERAGFLVDYAPGVWVKASEGKEATGQTNQPGIYLARSHEPFFIARKPNAKLRKEGRPNSFIFKPVSPSQKYHPTQRPLDMMTEIVNTFCWTGLGVLVPFLGSGVTLLACYDIGKNAMGFDLSESNKRHFLNMIIEHYGGGTQ